MSPRLILFIAPRDKGLKASGIVREIPNAPDVQAAAQHNDVILMRESRPSRQRKRASLGIAAPPALDVLACHT